MQAESELRGLKLYLALTICFIFGGLIGIAGYYGGIPIDIRRWMRLGLCILFLAVLLILKRRTPAWETALGFLAVSLGIYASGLLGGLLLDWFSISGEDARGYAVDKINETLPIIVIILAAVLLSGHKLRELYLKGGRLDWSLLGGLAVGVVLFAYFLSQGGWQVFQDGNLKVLMPTIAWITIFSIFNAFMEELWFRGVFLSRFEWLFGRRWAFWLTALLFGLLHAFGSFTGTLGSALLTFFTLLLGMAFGYIVQKTGSIWGAVLGHFFADFFMMLGYFATMG